MASTSLTVAPVPLVTVKGVYTIILPLYILYHFYSILLLMRKFVKHFQQTNIKKSNQHEQNVIYPSCLLEGGACVITEVGDGRVGCSTSVVRCRGREPGRTIVGVGAELATGFVRIS